MAVKQYVGRVPRRRGLTLVTLFLMSLAILVMDKEYPLIVRASDVFAKEGPAGVVDRVESYGRSLIGSPVEWPVATPESYDLDSSKLDEMAGQLSEKNTKAFLVIKDGHLVYEWYAKGYDSKQAIATSALSKPITGSMVLMAAMDDSRIDLDDPAWEYIPQWKDDPRKSKITIGELGSHRSGLDDVEFRDDVSPDWKLKYYQNPELRFSMALSQVPVLYEPGTRTSYSGVGYYVLAYAVAQSLQDSPISDVRQYLNTQIMEPLQIPPEAWDISYGEWYQQDGMRLYAIGSGGYYTPRAIARIGQFMLNRGEWNGQQLVKPETVDAILGRANSEQGPTSAGQSVGWVTNFDGHLASLPQDAFYGVGGGHETLLVIPSRNVVMVRMGGTLAPDALDKSDYMKVLEEQLFSPFMDAIDSGS